MCDDCRYLEYTNGEIETSSISYLTQEIKEIEEHIESLQSIVDAMKESIKKQQLAERVRKMTPKDAENLKNFIDTLGSYIEGHR
jgi:SMC interacting uncharacterized protein involved in chromosome segregation